MAILDSITIGQQQIIIVDTSPLISGITATTGSLILMSDGSGSFIKSGTNSSNWTQNITTQNQGTIGTVSSGIWNGSTISSIYLGLSGNLPIYYNNSTGVISIVQSTYTQSGYLSSTDWNTFNNKPVYASFSGTAPLYYNSITGQYSIVQSTTTQSGYLTNTDWNTFNSKQSTLVLGNVNGTDFIISGGTGSIIGTGLTLSLATINSNIGTFNNVAVNAKGLITSASNAAYITLGSLSGSAPIVYNNSTGIISILQSTSTQSGYLTNTDWNTFNNKQNALTLGSVNGSDFTITGGIGSIRGTGLTLSLATVNPNVGTWNLLTVNNKGLITSASNVAYITLSYLSATGPLTYNSATGSFGILQSTSTQSGYLSTTDWNIFNNKQSTLAFGNVNGSDFIISGGSNAIIGSGLTLSLATVNSNIGTFNNVTVNGKGLITSASNVSYLTTSSQVYLSNIIGADANQFVVSSTSGLTTSENIFYDGSYLTISSTSSFTNNVNFNGNNLINVATGSNPMDAVNYGQFVAAGLGWTYITGTASFNFGKEMDIVINTITNTSLTNLLFRGFTYIPYDNGYNSLDDFSLNGLDFNIENIIDNTSFDVRGVASNNASGTYSITYMIIYQ